MRNAAAEGNNFEKRLQLKRKEDHGGRNCPQEDSSKGKAVAQDRTRKGRELKSDPWGPRQWICTRRLREKTKRLLSYFTPTLRRGFHRKKIVLCLRREKRGTLVPSRNQTKEIKTKSKEKARARCISRSAFGEGERGQSLWGENPEGWQNKKINFVALKDQIQ